MIGFMLEQNGATIYLLIMSIAVDLWAAKRVDRTVDNPSLYMVLICTISLNIIISLIYFIGLDLYNISPITSMAMIVLLCKVLVDIYNEKLK